MRGYREVCHLILIAHSQFYEDTAFLMDQEKSSMLPTMSAGESAHSLAALGSVSISYSAIEQESYACDLPSVVVKRKVQ